MISPVSVASVFNETESKALEKLRKFSAIYSGFGHFSGFEYSHDDKYVLFCSYKWKKPVLAVPEMIITH